ncbi:MAG: DUF1698 domain-containing protein, partial [Marinobacter sp.]
MANFDWRSCFGQLLTELDNTDQSKWAEVIRAQLAHRFDNNPHGDLDRWQSAMDSLPDILDATAELNASAITLGSPHVLSVSQQETLESGLRGLMPWRKGPFDFFGVHIDTEWRSDWKWDRVSPYLSDLS